MKIGFLHQIREYELAKTSENFKFIRDSKLLEIGSGTGYQLKLLRNHVNQCVGVDIPEGTYSNNSSDEIIKYDGRNLPFPDNSFDYVFSSNVLEHIKDIELFQNEIKRVLKKDGYAIHILPTSLWQFYTIITHPFFVLKSLLKKFSSKKNTTTKYDFMSAKESESRKMSFSQKVLNLILPKRHGEKGNLLTELYYFSEVCWLKLFSKTGWDLEKKFSSKLFYTGNQLAPTLDIKSRVIISRLLGSSSKVYVIKPARSHIFFGDRKIKN